MYRFLVISLAVTCSSLTLGIVPASAQEQPSKKIKVFIMSGQSGVAGFGDSTKLPEAMRKGSDRILMFEDGRWQPLRPFHVYPDRLMKKFGLTEFSFGPEIGFGHAIAEAWPNETIGIVKQAAGGTGVLAWHPNWTKEQADRTKNAGRGNLFKALTDKVKAATASRDCELTGFVWLQGARDMSFPDVAKEYLPNLQAMVAGVRKEVGGEEMPFIYGSKRPSAADLPDDLSDLVPTLVEGNRPGALWVLKAQWEAQEAIPNAKMVIIRDLEQHPNDFHLSTAGNLQQGRILAEGYLDMSKKPRNQILGQEVKLPAATDLHSHGVTQDEIESLSEFLNQAVQQGRISGCSFLVAHKGEVVFRKAVGYADLEAKRPFTTDELLPIASVSKPFLASVLMALVEHGKLKLDDPVEKYLPEFKGIKVEGSQSPARPMTVRHLLSHTGGFWGNNGITPEKRDLIRNFGRPLSEAVKRMSEYDLVYEPGTKFLYSGSGYCVAGRVAEVALDQSLEEIAQDVLFRPLGLSRTTYLPSKEARKAVPAAYLRQGGKLRKQPSMAERELRFILPGGSLFTTLDELAAFGQMHLNDGVYNGKRILSEASVTEMRRLQSPERPRRSYGLGWFRGDVSESGLADQVFHGGALGTHFRIDRRREVVCVFLVHQTAVQVQDLKNTLVEQVNEMFPVGNGR
ncbi:MAG: hypothetical protein CMJ64_15360 [Planctomycetaceae bacterium]|nr:hypothetical protein [Planctomycetaceae bacterium]